MIIRALTKQEIALYPCGHPRVGFPNVHFTMVLAIRVLMAAW
jgi:hypothetical protein